MIKLCDLKKYFRKAKKIEFVAQAVVKARHWMLDTAIHQDKMTELLNIYGDWTVTGFTWSGISSTLVVVVKSPELENNSVGSEYYGRI